MGLAFPALLVLMTACWPSSFAVLEHTHGPSAARPGLASLPPNSSDHKLIKVNFLAGVRPGS